MGVLGGGEAAIWPDNKIPGPLARETGCDESGWCGDVVRLADGTSLLNAALSRDALLRGSDAPSLRVLQG